MTQQAVLLAAGEGRRLRPLTLTTPKPLLRVGGKPLIHWQLERLAAVGVTQVIINLAWLGQQIREYLTTQPQLGLEVIFSEEPAPLETGGALLFARHRIHADSFWLVNADSWCPALPPLSEPAPGQVQLGMVPNPAFHPQGDFYFNSSTGQLACSASPATPNTATFSGISRFSRQVLSDQTLLECYGKHYTPGEAFALAPLLRFLIQKGRAQGLWIPQGWVDVGTPERLQALDAEFK